MKLALAALLALPGLRAQEVRPTAEAVVASIRSHLGIPWRAETVDTFKAGDPGQPVTGIAVTMMATLDVLQRASAQGLNFVITHEPTFYAHGDRPAGMPEEDPVWAAKRAFIAEHRMVVWRFHDHWHARKPDGILQGTARALGWERFQSKQDPTRFVLPPTTVQRLAGEVASRLRAPAVRFVGDPGMTVTRVALHPGAPGCEDEFKALESDTTEVLLVGETREWETIAYAADAETAGKRKALILIGHTPSEQPGMEVCAAWLKEFVTQVPVVFVEARQPFRTLQGDLPPGFVRQ
jgi:putative NIF3 family GTP cyclohydrolase 1 type 2